MSFQIQDMFVNDAVDQVLLDIDDISQNIIGPTGDQCNTGPSDGP
jgi:hypothetical protein